MKVLITGCRGTVGSALAAVCGDRGDEVVGWDRGAAPPNDRAACEAYLEEVSPARVFHLAVASSGTGLADEGRVVAVEWSGVLSEWCRSRGVPFLYSSTAMVFTNDAVGPFTVESEADATDGYGGEKLEGERRVMASNPDAVVARLGWQIGEAPGSNNMIDFMAKRMEDEGAVKASRLWKPATSFLDDTAAALAALIEMPGGVYLVDGNRAGHSFFDICTALSEQRHGGAFTVEADDSFVYDQRMIDERVPVTQLGERLSLPDAG